MMSRSRNYISNKATIYIIAIVVLVTAFILLEGGSGTKGILQQVDQSLGLINWKWAQIIISLLIGFLLGIGINKRK